MKPLICPKCEKEFKDVLGVRAAKRLSGHLKRKHNLRGDEFWRVMGEAFKRAYEKETNKHLGGKNVWENSRKTT